MTKVMTLIVACENLEEKDVFEYDKKGKKTETPIYLEVLKKHVDAASGGSNNVGLKEGEFVAVADLIYLISADSNAIATMMIAEYVAGDVSGFVDMMNAKAADLGLTATHFSNPIGFHDENNYSTCREIASIMAYAIDNQKIVDSMKRIQGGYKIKVYDKNDNGELIQKRETTAWLGWLSKSRMDDNDRLTSGTILGAKTGGEQVSGVWLYSLVSYAEIGGRKYINVIVTKGTNSGENVSSQTSSSEVKYIYNTYAKKP